MEKFTKWVKEKKEVIFLILMLLIWVNGCQNNRQFKGQINVITSDIQNNKAVNDSILELFKKQPTNDDINTQFAIEGYRISKRILYDNNLIVRTKERPDDRMNEYDNEIDKLRKNVKVVRK